MVGIIQEICQKHGIVFRTYSDDWVIELERQKVVQRIFGYKFDVNSSAASSIAGDKVAAYQIMHQKGVAAVEHRLVQTKAGQYSAWSDGLDKVVVKPLDGTSGHAVKLLDTAIGVRDYISAHPHIAAWAVSPYQIINSERRFIMLDGEVLCQYEKIPVENGDLKMFNLGLGAKPIMTEASSAETALAKDALNATGLRLAAIDVVSVDDSYKILEVNDGMMMENFMRQSQAHKHTGYEIYQRIIAAMFA